MSLSIPLLTNEQLLEVFTLTKTATAIHVTEDAIIQTANDAMLNIWDKDRSIIGKSLEDALPELKGQPFIEMFKRVWNEGLTISGTDTPADLNIDGQMRTVYFDFEYRAIKEASGKTICILHTAVDVTDRYLGREAMRYALEKEEALEREQALNEELASANEELSAINEEFQESQDNLHQLNIELEERVKKRTSALADSQVSLQKLNDELAAINEEMTASNEELIAINEELAEAQVNLFTKISELAESESRFRSLVEQAPVAINIFKTKDLLIDIANNKMLEIWGKSKDILGKPLAEAMPELENQPFLEILDDVLTTGEPYYGNESRARVIRNGKEVDAYFNLIYKPIRNINGVTDGILQVANDVTEQVLIKLELEKAQKMMQLAIEAAKLGSWYIDPVSKNLKYNHMLAKLFGYEGKEDMTYEMAIGQVTPDYREKITEEIEKAILSGGDYDITYSQKRFNDGEIIWLRSLGKINQNEQDGLSTFSGFVMDITELKKDEQRKNDFIGMVSHELKTPLTSLNGYIQLLQAKADGKGDKFTAGALATAGKQVKKMTAMINGFLNISRLESGKIVLNKSNLRLDELVQTVIEETMVITASHNISLTCEAPIQLSADYDKISNVVSNLLSNAIKYAPNHRDIAVNCAIVNNMAQVSVTDHGPGIAKDQVPQLFERYYRAETNHTISGFGIGLYLSSEIIDRHNGRIWAESEIGKGSTFYFLLPIN